MNARIRFALLASISLLAACADENDCAHNAEGVWCSGFQSSGPSHVSSPPTSPNSSSRSPSGGQSEPQLPAELMTDVKYVFVGWHDDEGEEHQGCPDDAPNCFVVVIEFAADGTYYSTDAFVDEYGVETWCDSEEWSVNGNWLHLEPCDGDSQSLPFAAENGLLAIGSSLGRVDWDAEHFDTCDGTCGTPFYYER